MAFNAFSEMRENTQGSNSEAVKKQAKDPNDIKNISNSAEGSILRKSIKNNKEAPVEREASQYAKTVPTHEVGEVKKLSDMPSIAESRANQNAEINSNSSISEDIQKRQVLQNESEEKKEGKEGKFITFVDHEGKEYKIPNTAKAKAKVAKEEKEIELQKLLNHEAGLVDWNKKYSEFDVERKKWVEDANKTSAFFEEFGKRFGQNPTDGLTFLAEKFNMSPVKVKRLLRETVGKESQEYYAMDENQRRLFDLQEENEYNRRVMEQMTAQRKAHTENEVYEAGMREVMAVHKIDERKKEQIEEWVLGDSGNKLSPDDLVYYSKEYDRINSLYDVAADISPELEQDEDLIAFLDARTRRSPEMSKIEIKRLAKRYLGAYEAVKEESEEIKAAEILKPKVQEPVARAEPKHFNKPVRITDLLGTFNK